MLDKNKIKVIKTHFKKTDPVIYKIIKTMDFKVLKKSKKPSGYLAQLCREIITQQLASKAAKSIRDRFNKLFKNKKPTVDKILSLADKDLRCVGMSWAKARYIKDLALKTKNKEIKFKNLHTLDDQAVILELIKVKGIGNWTAQMFLIFTLGREDVFSHGDLGLRKAIERLYNFKKKPSEKQISKIVDKWTPYKSYGCLALWESVDG